MALVLETTYSKKLGLPGYSSHQFSVSLKVEISDVSQVQAESARLYRLLQDGVDSSIKEIGYLPQNGNGNGHGHSNGNGRPPASEKEIWNCSEKQKDLIQKIVTEHKLEKQKIEGLALERFGKGVKTLNKLEASGLIEELLEMTGQSKGTGRGRFHNGAGAK